MLGDTRAKMGHRLKNGQKQNCINLAFTFTGLIKDSRYFRTNKHKANLNSLCVNRYSFRILTSLIRITLYDFPLCPHPCCNTS